MFFTIFVIIFVTTHCQCQNTHGHGDNVGIMGGNTIAIEKAPYMASIRADGVHICGGSIIDKRFILTAAHCMNLTTVTYQVVVGTDMLYEGAQFHDIEDLFVHEKYSNVTFDYDICILKLRGELNITKRVKRIKLFAGAKLSDLTTVRATGWGSTKPNGTLSKNLRQVRMPIVSTNICQRIYSNRLHITRNMICAGRKGKDACAGDSGGPLSFTGKNKEMQVGITSCGALCGTEPTIYTKITALLPWIKHILKQNN